MLFKRKYVDKSMKKFEKFYNPKGMNESKETKDVYYTIKKEYESKIADNSIDIKSEKIRLEGHIGKYYSANENMYISLFVSMLVSSFITIYLRKFIEEIAKTFGTADEFIAYFIIITSFIIIMGICFDFFIKRSLGKRTLYNICLKVLEDIENEKKKKILKNIKNLYAAYDEVASDKEEKLECIKSDIEKIKKFVGIK